jgi:hypothetical protein
VAALLTLLPIACFDGETRILAESPNADAGGGGSGDGGTGGGAGAGGGAAWPDDACRFEITADDLSGFEGDPGRWTAREGRITAAGDAVAGTDRSLLLRGAEETCSAFTASVMFTHAPGAFPMLLGRVTADGQWVGVGYDGAYGNLTATNGLGTELRDRIGDLDPVDLTPGAEYRLEMRVLDHAVLGLLFDAAAETPIALVQGPTAELQGPGRIGLYEAAGISVRFGTLRAEPEAAVSPADALPDLRVDSARVLGPQTLLVTLTPGQATAVEVASAEGFSVEAGGRTRAVSRAEVRPGTTRELLLALAEPVEGRDLVKLGYDPALGGVRDAAQRPLTAAEALPVVNLLHADGVFAPFEETFEGDAVPRSWSVVQPEAFTVSRGEVRVAPTDAYATGAMLLRPIAERHRDATVTMDFRYTREPSRGLGRIEAVAALRARSFASAQYQAALSIETDRARLWLRHMAGGQATELATTDVPLGRVPADTPLSLTFSATGPLLTATLADAAGAMLARTAAQDTRIPGAGPAGVTGQWDGTVFIDRVSIGPAEAPPPFIADARVRAETPDRVDVRVMSTTPLRAGSPAGFTVWAGDRRTVEAVTVTESGLSLRISGPTIQRGQTVVLAYDAAAGDVTDSAEPARPLTGVDALPVLNEAAPGNELAVAGARLVTPHTLDLLTTDDGALPIRVDGDPAPAVRVEVDRAPAEVVRAYALGAPHGNVLRVTLREDVRAGQDVTVAYTAGGAGRVLDAQDREMRGFVGAPVTWAVPQWPSVPASADAFDRPDVDLGLDNGWLPATEGLWSIEDSTAVYQGAGVESLDPRASRPGLVGPRYIVSTTVWSSAFDPAQSQPVAWVFGSLTRADPRRPVGVQAGFDFSARALMLQTPDGATTYGPAAPAETNAGPGARVHLRLEVHGRAVRAQATDDAGRTLSFAQVFLPTEPAPGELGIAGSARARVLYFDDFAVEDPAGEAPNMLVTDLRITPDSPNAVLLQAATSLGAAGELLTGGGPRGFRVEVDGELRGVVAAEGVGSGLRVHFAGPPVARRQRVTLAYDDRQGDVHDASQPIARPLDGFPARTADNGAAVGADLFVVTAETVAPWAVDLVMNDEAALPARGEADVATAFTLLADDVSVPVRAVLPLPGRDPRVRLVLGAALSAGQRVRVTYVGGGAGARLLDADGAELQAPDALEVGNTLEPAADFEPFRDTFGGVGAGIVNGWLAAPEHDWSRNAGDAVLSSEDEGLEGMLLRPAEEAETHVVVATSFRPNPPPVGALIAGVAARIAPGRGYRFLIEPENAERAGLTLVKADEMGIRVLGRTSLPALTAGEDHRLVVRAHGPVLQATLSREGDASPLARLLVIDPTPLGAGQHGVLGRTVGQVRFHEVSIAPATGYPARVVATSARAYTYAPDTVRVTLEGAAPIALADGGGFAVTVDAAPRAVLGVIQDATGVDLRVDGPPLTPGQDIRVRFDPTLGYIYDDSAVPQALGAFEDLPVDVVEAPLLLSAEAVGANLVALDFALSPAQGALGVEGDGGLRVDVRAPVLGPAPVAFGIDEVWLDPAGGGQRLFVATTDDLPPGAEVRLSTAQRPGNQVVDALGTPLADFGVEAVGDAATATAGGPFPDIYSHDWRSEDPWAYHGPVDAWTPLPGALVGTGARVAEGAITALAPPATSGRDLRVSADFEVDADVTPFGRPAYPRVIARGYNDGTWLGCFVRNDLPRVPLRDAEGAIVGAIDAASPALVCGRRLDFGPPRLFEDCRMQFYDTVAGQPTVRYDWAAFANAPHRLEVAVLGHALRARLLRLEAGGPVVVAAVDVPEIGDDLNAGLPGVGAGDGGTVRYTAFSVSPSGPDDFTPLDAAYAPSGECR